ncbi:MAG: MBL fold metallo-hydrolase [Pseudomonadota bacterium]
MKWIVRIGVGLVGLAVIGFIGFQMFRTQIIDGLFQRAIEQRLDANTVTDLPDGLHVFMCGTGSPMPDIARSGPCIGIMAGDRGFIFDMGSGGTRKLGVMGFPMLNLEKVYLTHLHSDHIDGLGELMLQAWVGGERSSPIPIEGPIGTVEVVDGFVSAYRIDSTYRVAHHGADIVNPGGFGAVASEITLPLGPGATTVVLEDDDLKITAIRVDHSPIDPALAFRVDYKGRSISLSGDTVYSDNFVSASKGVDVMFHEALNREMVIYMGDALAERGQRVLSKIMYDITDYHTSPREAAEAASAAEAGQLVYYHIVPPLPIPALNPLFARGADKLYDGDITIGNDGMIFSLPVGTTKVSLDEAF